MNNLIIENNKATINRLIINTLEVENLKKQIRNIESQIYADEKNFGMNLTKDETFIYKYNNELYSITRKESEGVSYLKIEKVKIF